MRRAGGALGPALRLGWRTASLAHGSAGGHLAELRPGEVPLAAYALAVRQLGEVATG